MVARGGIEPPTRGFSVHCSTTELPSHKEVAECYHFLALKKFKRVLALSFERNGFFNQVIACRERLCVERIAALEDDELGERVCDIHVAVFNHIVYHLPKFEPAAVLVMSLINI